jgi:U32 family peptidase
MEILAPAGNKASMIGAINAGANAIYLAGKRFGARAYANNFEDSDLFEVISYAHLRGVLVYVAINTLVYDDEIEGLIQYTDQLVKHHVDALIVQDLGVIDLLTKRYPNTDIHASTQVNAHNIHQVRFLKQLGVKRIVMARETPIDLIRQIKKQVDIELEVFVHGALCVCFSGNCLMSSMQGGRSGNRGECAQPCRLPYTLLKNGKPVSDMSYLLSTKDLMTLEYLDQLIEAGVDSIKIEGRMRKPEYVIQAVSSYHQACVAYENKKKIQFENEVNKLKKVFNREFTKGYLFEEKPNDINHDYRPNHMGVELGTVIDCYDHKVSIKLTDTLEINDGYRIIGEVDYGNTVSRIIKGNELIKKALPGDIIKLDVTENIQKGSRVLKTLDKNLESSLAPFLDEHYKTIALVGEVDAYPNQLMKLTISDHKHVVTVYSEAVLSSAQSKPVDQFQIADQISKLGNTPFFFEELKIHTDEKAFIPVKVMNELRRQAIDEISKLRTDRLTQPINEQRDLHVLPMDDLPQITLKVTTIKQLDEAIKSNINVIYYEDIIKDVTPSDRLIPVKKRIQLHADENIAQIQMVHDIGSLLTKLPNQKIHTDEFMNVTNIYTVRLLSSLGVSKVTLSPELSKDRIQSLVTSYMKTYHQMPGLELVIYGRVDVMISKYCPIAKTYKTKQNCHLCEINPYQLMDRLGLKFPLINDGNCHLRILNHKPLHLLEYAKEMMDLGISVRLHMTTEEPTEVKEIIDSCQNAITHIPSPASQQRYTYGRFLK